MSAPSYHQNPAISVVITCYNYGQYLPTAIDSVLKQSRAVDEIVVVDDGSTDNTRHIIKSYGALIRPVFQDNLGAEPAKINGFRFTRGNYVLFLDADDYLYPNAIEMTVEHLRKNVAKVQYELDFIDVKGRRLGRRFCNFPVGYNADYVQHEFAETGTYRWPVASGNIYSRELVNRALPVDQPIPLDGLLNTLAPLYGLVITITEPLGAYRAHSDSVSQSLDIRTRIRVRKLEFEQLKLHARQLNVVLPDVDFLDLELTFVNYRIVARKLRREDGDDSQRSLFSLWRAGVKAAIRNVTGWRLLVSHLLWLTCLSLAPAPFARAMILLRASRTQLKSAWYDLSISLKIRRAGPEHNTDQTRDQR